MLVDDTPERLAARRQLRRRGVLLLYEDNHLLGLCKPAGLLSQGGPKGARSLTDHLSTYRQQAEGKPGRAYVGLVHRLDRNVSGAMVVTKTSKAASRLAADFRDRSPSLVKTYIAWVQRVPPVTEDTLEHRLRRDRGVTKLAAEGDDDGRIARLHYQVEAVGHHTARLRITLLTGYAHQIRAQLSHIGHPLIGDEKYGGPSAKRPALHATTLAFEHPVRHVPMLFGAPVPEELTRIDKRFGLAPAVGG